MKAIANKQITDLFLDTPKKVGLEELVSPQKNKYDLYYCLDNPNVKVAIARGEVKEGSQYSSYSLVIKLAAIIAEGEEPLFLHVASMVPANSNRQNDWKLYQAVLFYDDKYEGPKISTLMNKEIFWYEKRVKWKEVNFYSPKTSDLKLLVNGGFKKIGVTNDKTYSSEFSDIPTGWNELFNDVTEGVIAKKYTIEEINRMAEEKRRLKEEAAEKKRIKAKEAAEEKQREQELFAAQYPLLAKIGLNKTILNIIIAVVLILLIAYVFG